MTDGRARLAAQIRAAVPMAPAALIDAFAAVPRERFLPRGPWQIRDASGARMTENADPAHVYADVSIAIDAARDLYNGQPSTVARWFEALDITPGDRVLHIGPGSGYYSAILASTVGPRGHVTAIEIDEQLAGLARANLADWSWVDVRAGDGVTNLPVDIDVIVVHAGSSHVRPEWLSCMRPGARALVPITVDFAAMGPTLGKGLAFRFTRHDSGWDAAALSFVAIYSMQSARDSAMAAVFGQAMQGHDWEQVRRLRTDAHEHEDACWCHWSTTNCLSR